RWRASLVSPASPDTALATRWPPARQGAPAQMTSLPRAPRHAFRLGTLLAAPPVLGTLAVLPSASPAAAATVPELAPAAVPAAAPAAVSTLAPGSVSV